MSLYCFGKVVPASASDALLQCAPASNVARLFLRDLEPGDVSTLSEINELKRVGITFRYVDKEGGAATALWLAASDISRFDTDYSDAIRATELGGFIWNVFHCPAIKFGGLALVDGGIETILRANRLKCWNHFLVIISKPWDCHDNPLFLWNGNDE